MERVGRSGSRGAALRESGYLGKRTGSMVTSVEREKEILNSLVPRKSITLKTSEKLLAEKIDKELHKALSDLFKLENPSEVLLD